MVNTSMRITGQPVIRFLLWSHFFILSFWFWVDFMILGVIFACIGDIVKVYFLYITSRRDGGLWFFFENLVFYALSRRTGLFRFEGFFCIFESKRSKRG